MCPATADQGPNWLLRLEHVSSVKFVRATRARFVRSLLCESEIPRSSIAWRVLTSCHVRRVFCPELDFTAVSTEISTHFHFRLVGHQLTADACKRNVSDELSGALQMFVDVTCEAWHVL